MGEVSAMIDLKKLYISKLTTPDEAVKYVPSGAVCATDCALAESSLFYEAVGKAIMQKKVSDVTQHILVDIGGFPFYREDFVNEYHGISWFSSGDGRKAVNHGWADVMPAYFRDFPQLHRQYIKADVFVGVVSPMDKHGFFSVGASSAISAALLENAKVILLEVNSNMPRSLSGQQIHISQVTALWENNAPLFTLPPTRLDEVSEKIGAYIAEEIPNGSTIQLGIGSIPDAVGLALKDKQDLGIHSEIFTDSMVDLLECGAVNNSKKPIHRGKTVVAFAIGSRRMYDLIDDNPAIEILAVDYVNEPAIIAQHPQFMSINAALEVDFFGQVCAEAVGTRHISGTGGQSDYVRGATQSNGGKSFIALPSTAQNGTVSRIMPTLTPGALVSTSKNDVDHIVTEYGIAKLRGKTLSQRTKALISIAHPQFREELMFKAKKQNILI